MSSCHLVTRSNVEENACPPADFPCRAVVQPQSLAELCDTVRRAAAEGSAIYPLGGRTMLDLGLPPTRPGLGVDLRQLADVIDYPARDMTITVQAGITLARLREVLRAENQRLPIDVPRADRATLGGALATNTSGPRRYGYGTLRDYVIGISAVNDKARRSRPAAGSSRTSPATTCASCTSARSAPSASSTQVTLKLRPLPEEQALIMLGCPEETVGPAAGPAAPVPDPAGLHRPAQPRPRCGTSISRPAAALPEAAWVLVVGFEDNRRGRHLAGAAARQGSIGRPDAGPGRPGRPRRRAVVGGPGRVPGTAGGPVDVQGQPASQRDRWLLPAGWRACRSSCCCRPTPATAS